MNHQSIFLGKKATLHINVLLLGKFYVLMSTWILFAHLCDIKNSQLKVRTEIDCLFNEEIYYFSVNKIHALNASVNFNVDIMDGVFFRSNILIFCWQSRVLIQKDRRYLTIYISILKQFIPFFLFWFVLEIP